MRRALVITDESARHPFRATLPPHVRAGHKSAANALGLLTVRDVKDFLLAYCACFVAVSAFII